jgi:hypothetical protein
VRNLYIVLGKNKAKEMKLCYIERTIRFYNMLFTNKNSKSLIKNKFITSTVSEKLPIIEDEKLEETKIAKDSYEIEIEETEVVGDVEENLKYSYLEDDETILSRIEPNIDHTRPFKKMVCFYRLNDSLEEPFIEYLFKKENEIYIFPFETYEPGIHGGNGEYDKLPEEAKDILVNQEPKSEDSLKDETSSPKPSILETLFPFLSSTVSKKEFPQYPTLEEQIKEIAAKYFKGSPEIKGFITVIHQSMPYYIGFIDCTTLESSPPQEKEDIIWGIMDEIIEKKRVLNTTIDDIVFRLFAENSSLIYIKKHSDLENTNVLLPHSLYLCQEDPNKEYDNVYFTNSRPFEFSTGNSTDNLEQAPRAVSNLRWYKNQSITVFNNTISSPIFGTTYLFTREPLENQNIENIKRFAVRIENPLYIFNHDKDITHFVNAEENEYQEENISFFISDIAFWTIKDPNAFTEIIS